VCSSDLSPPARRFTASAAAADAVKRLAGGDSWDAVAKSLGSAAKPPQYVARSDQSVPIEIRASAFEAPKPKAQPLYRDVTLANGDAAVYALSGVREDPSGDAQQQNLALRRQYAAQMASVEAQGYAAAARTEAQVTLNPQAID